MTRIMPRMMPTLVADQHVEVLFAQLQQPHVGGRAGAGRTRLTGQHGHVAKELAGP